jgi:hypothetical protein
MSPPDWRIFVLSHHGKRLGPHFNLDEARKAQKSDHLVSLEIKRRTSCMFIVRAGTVAFQPLRRPCPPYTQPCPSLKTGRPRDSPDHHSALKWCLPDKDGFATFIRFIPFSVLFASVVPDCTGRLDGTGSP